MNGKRLVMWVTDKGYGRVHHAAMNRRNPTMLDTIPVAAMPVGGREPRPRAREANIALHHENECQRLGELRRRAAMLKNAADD